MLSRSPKDVFKLYMIFEGGNTSVKMLEKNHSSFGPDFMRSARICVPPGNSMKYIK